MVSLLDIIGPVMVGPSSSHTAGAYRLGLLARGLIGGTPQ
ncbi:MAG: L-serine ammonia-lyase, iron-sulfur-dependent, subunit beta, partial [Gemmatimonadaceae bacterium]